MKLSELAAIVQGVLHGDEAVFSRVIIDSRIAQSGDCFFAIKGDVFDGHNFVKEVEAKGVSVVIVDRVPSLTTPYILVEDTKKALISLAKYYRHAVQIPVVGITGSCGKTTTRAFIENILKHCGHVLASQKSFNNDIGLPLTLFQLTPEHDFAVLEIGTNHPGEIAALTAIAKPTIAVITMIAGVHMEGFGSLENIAKEKSDIYETAHIAVINADDPFADLFKKRVQNKKIITFGVNTLADVMAQTVMVQPNGCASFRLVIPAMQIDVPVTLPLLGEHNVGNALAAAALAYGLHIPFEKIQLGLETALPEYGRLNIKQGLLGATIIDDSYNANPTSVKAAIEILITRAENTILVLGDMKELGEMAQDAHADIGRCAKMAGVSQLFCYGDHAKLAAEAFGENAFHFMDQQALIVALKPQLNDKTAVLVKGSNSMKMVNVVNSIIDSHP